jgi:hypothetical protein
MAITFNVKQLIQGAVGATIGGAGVNMATSAAGDRVIVWMTVNGANLTLKSPWNVIDQYADANGTSGMFWMWNTGDTTNITVDWGGSSQTWHGQAVAYTGADYLPVGAKNKAHGTASPITIAQLTTQQSNSIVMASELIFANSQVIPLPLPYTNIDQFNDANGSDRISYETLGTAGSPSDAVSGTITTANWNSYGTELIGALTTNYPYVSGISGHGTQTGTSISVGAIATNPGDFCICWCQVMAAGQTMTVSGAGWSLLMQDTTNGMSVAVATAATNAVAGTTTGPTFTWTTSNACQAQFFVWHGQGAVPIGATSVNTGNSATASSTPITTTGMSSVVLLWGFTTVNNMFSQNPAYYVDQAYSDGTRASSLQNARVPASGTVTPTYSQPFVGAVSQPWKVFTIELVSAPAPAASILMGQQLTW